jgi:hypothetical protein
MLVYKREVISRKQSGCGDQGENFLRRAAVAAGRGLAIALQALPPSPNSTVRRPGVSARLSRMKRSAIGGGYCRQARLRSATPAPGTVHSIADDARRHQASQPRHIRPREVLNRWESRDAEGQADTSLCRIARFRRGSRRGPLLASQCRASAQGPGLVSFPAPGGECECPTGQSTGLQRRLLGMLHQDGRRPRSVHRSQILRDASGFFGGID